MEYSPREDTGVCAIKIQALKRYNKDDYSGATQWFLTFLDNINTTIDTLNPLLQGNVDIDNNLLAERQTVTLSHATAIKVKMRDLTIRPTLVRVGYAGGYVGSCAVQTYNVDGTITIICYFQGTPPTVPVATTLIFEP